MPSHPLKLPPMFPARARAACAGPRPAAIALLTWICVGCHADLSKGEECYRLGDYTRAKRIFEAAVDRDPGSFRARYGYALSLQELCLARKALGQDQAGDWYEVVKAYEICAKLGAVGTMADNYCHALFHFANKLYQEGRYEDALRYLDRARRMEPGDRYVLNLDGIVQYSLGRYQDAQSTFEYLLALDPGFISAYLNLGNVLWEAGQEDAALAAWKQGLQKSPGNEAIVRRIRNALKSIAGP